MALWVLANPALSAKELAEKLAMVGGYTATTVAQEAHKARKRLGIAAPPRQYRGMPTRAQLLREIEELRASTSK